jgi:preprotein translocase subunit YajC
MEGRGTIGRITAIHDNAFVITRPDGTNVTVNITDKTEFRKDRQPAKQADFKVGDFVMVHGEENSDHTVTAQAIGGRTTGGGPGGPGGGPMFGEMGKDFVAGEVKSIDAPKLTVLRPDNVTQTVELNEETSLRKGRESITMADIQPGDHVVIHGALQNNVFVPKNLMLLSPEQWERMQQFAKGGGTAGNAPSGPTSGKPPQQ